MSTKFTNQRYVEFLEQELDKVEETVYNLQTAIQSFYFNCAFDWVSNLQEYDSVNALLELANCSPIPMTWKGPNKRKKKNANL